MSSHLLLDLERICDHLVLLSASRVQLCGDIETLLGEHKVLTAPRRSTGTLEQLHSIVSASRTSRETSAVVRLGGAVLDPDWQVDDISLEELVLAYMGRETTSGTLGLASLGGGR
jgi:ABC-2 type transport system ATP-binding protein